MFLPRSFFLGESTSPQYLKSTTNNRSNAEAGIGLICACLPSINAFIVRRQKGSTYYAQSRSSRKNASHGGIVLTRSYHVDSSRTTKNGREQHDFEMGSDQAELVGGSQDDLRSNNESRGSLSTVDKSTHI